MNRPVVAWTDVRESVVLCPGATLEDFPARLDDDLARGLLAAASAAFHPRVLAATEATPIMGRADSPPTAASDTVVWLPEVSRSKLPDAFDSRAADAAMPVFSGEDRAGFLRSAGLDDPAPWEADGQTSVSVDDFFAAGFTMLQIQIMTRRLRYTSNLDEIHVQSRLVDAAKKFCSADPSPQNHADVVEALHDVFDALASERDHYFASDPHLVDLTLVPASVVGNLSPIDDDSLVPTSFLMDVAAAETLARSNESDAKRVVEQIRTGDIAIAGGGPDAGVRLDLATLNSAEGAFRDARHRIETALGVAPKIYGRFEGATPKDLFDEIVRLGYQGMIPIDFASGTGFEDEAKVIVSTQEGEVEALTSRPIDASSDSEFLDIGARLGTAIDSGEIATALLVHFPGGGCDSYRDLCRAASWGLALGKFWKLDDYFVDGERPYHHGNGGAVSDVRTDSPVEAMAGTDFAKDPIGALSTPFRDAIIDRHRHRCLAIASLSHASVMPGDEVETTIAAAIGAIPSESLAATLIFNPDVAGRRCTVTIDGPSPTGADHIFAATPVDASSKNSAAFSSTRGLKLSSGTDVTVDVPAGGFVVARPGNGSAVKNRGGWLKSVTRIVSGNDDRVAKADRLENEFMDVTLESTGGGIAGVYSARRGNRLSMRIVGEGDASGLTMKAREVTYSNFGPASGLASVEGDLNAEDGRQLGTYAIAYQLDRGSRCLTIRGNVKLSSPVSEGDENYIAMRIAMPDGSASYRWIIRDKLHRINRRRITAPAGYLIDQGDGEILMASGGDPLHRRVGERFVDTVLIPGGGREHAFEYRLGFDCTGPVSTAINAIVPPIMVPVEPHDSLPMIGYLAHTKTADGVVLDTTVTRGSGDPNDSTSGDDQPGELTVTMRLLQTRAQAGRATLRFCHDIVSAFCLATHADDDHEFLPINDDAVVVKLAPHGTATVRVTLKL